MDHLPRFAQQLKKGVLEMLVLQLLTEEPGHGYQLIVRLRQAGQGLLDIKEGTLYPILYRLEEEGYISSAWSTPDNRGAAGRMPRRVYTVTSAGQDLLAQEKETWQQFADCVMKSLGRDAQ